MSRNSYVVTTVLNAPYCMLNRDGRYEGFIVDILDKIAESAGFNYTLRPSQAYGSLGRDGRWTGMVGELVRREADIAAADLTITSMRERVVDFTKPFQSTTTTMLAKIPSNRHPSVTFLWQSVSMEAWVSIIIACLVVALLFVLIGRFDPFEWSKVAPGKDPRGARNSFGLRNSFMFVFSTLTWQGYRETPRSMAGRVLTVFWFLFVALIYLAYIANTTAVVMTRRFARTPVPFRSISDIVRDKSVEVGVLEHGSTFSNLRLSKVPTYQNLANYIVAKNSFFKNYEEGVERVGSSKGKYVMLTSSTFARYMASKRCNLMVYGGNHFPRGYGLATSIGSSLREMLNTELLNLLEEGLLHQLERKWWSSDFCGDLDLGDKIMHDDADPSGIGHALDTRDIGAGLLLLLAGALSAVVCLGIEVVVSRRRTVGRHDDGAPGEMTTKDVADVKPDANA